MDRPTAAVIISLALIAAGTFIAAGPLSPPAGPVASSYKTLSEAEPRVAINSLVGTGGPTWTYSINQPGSYYLTGNLVGENGKRVVRIGADNVTIDLNGFTIDGSAGATRGIDGETLDANNVTVRNGTIR